MKKQTLIAIFTTVSIFFLSTSTNGQGWAKPGAKWHYTEWIPSFSNDGFTRFEYAGDTVIQGYSCSKIHQWRHWWIVDSTFLEHDDLGEKYYRIYNNVVYRFINGSFYTMFDFNALPGDTVYFAWENFEIWPGACDTMGYYLVDSIGVQNINGFLEPYQDVSVTDPFHSWGNDVWHERIFKRFGSERFLLTYRYGCDSMAVIDGTIFGPLCSYQDDTLGVFNYTGTCNISLDVNEFIQTSNAIYVSPNPFNSEISISFKNQNVKQTSVCIKNVLGQEVFSNNNYQNPKSLDLQLGFLKNGIYFMEIITDNQKVVKKIVKTN